MYSNLFGSVVGQIYSTPEPSSMSNIQSELVKVFSAYKYPIVIDDDLKQKIYEGLTKEICTNLHSQLKEAVETFYITTEEVLKLAFGFQEWRIIPNNAKQIYLDGAYKLIEEELKNKKIPFTKRDNYNSYFFFEVKDLYDYSKAATRKILI